MHPTHTGRIRRLVPTLGTAFALTLVAVGPATATASAATGQAGKAEALKVVLLEKEPVFGDMNAMTPGNVLLFEEPAVDPQSGKPIGDSLTRIQLLKDGSFLLDCTVRLAKGNLVFSGGEESANVAKKVTFAVIGGTGQYSGASGQVESTPTTVQGQKAALLEFQLHG
ncbi:hypothetical protein [Streptomyces sp. ISL-94]|uniref:hypothetical protein n=1 Tax=Streptomyces sp. ISL-94 TaxID=2819190 RepID=UPI001BED0186|nr:hypothetical protein [Streptomyces sp. ISL-94]MBT2478494.1 hypothetical protein [Streptomyces sp. ISL-94]